MPTVTAFYSVNEIKQLPANFTKNVFIPLAEIVLYASLLWIAVTVLGIPAVCQTTPDRVITSNLYRMLSGIEADHRVILVMQESGLPLPSWLSEDDPDDLERIQRLLNNIPKPDWQFSPNGGSVDKVYTDILLGGEVAKRTLSSEEQKTLASVKALLFREGNPPEPSVPYAHYLKYKVAYEAAATPAAKTKALQDWQGLGQKHDIEAALNSYNELNADPLASWWAGLAKAVGANKRNDSSGSTYLFTDTSPQYSALFDDDGWTHLAIAESDLSEDVRSVVLFGQIPSVWNLWRQGPPAGPHGNTDVSFSSSTVSVSLDVKRARIDRPWLDSLVLNSRAWRWLPSASNILISDGNFSIGSNQGGHGEMQLLPVEVVLVKNVRLQFSDPPALDRIRTSIRSHRALSWGPFEIAGHYLNDTTLETVSPVLNRASVSIPDVQIVGWYCTPVVKLPNPDPNLFPQ